MFGLSSCGVNIVLLKMTDNKQELLQAAVLVTAVAAGGDLLPLGPFKGPQEVLEQFQSLANEMERKELDPEPPLDLIKDWRGRYSNALDLRTEFKDDCLRLTVEAATHVKTKGTSGFVQVRYFAWSYLLLVTVVGVFGREKMGEMHQEAIQSLGDIVDRLFMLIPKTLTEDAE